MLGNFCNAFALCYTKVCTHCSFFFFVVVVVVAILIFDLTFVFLLLHLLRLLVRVCLIIVVFNGFNDLQNCKKRSHQLASPRYL